MDDLDRLIRKERGKIKKFDEKLAIEEKRLEVALQIAHARKAVGLTQKDLATAVKTTQSVISRIETGNQNITIEILYRIANALGKNISLKLV